MPKCIICEKDFRIKPNGRQGGNNRQFCYDCLPEGIEKAKDRAKAAKFLVSQKLEKEKISRGCDICGYNVCGAALEWHHVNNDKEFAPSSIGVCNWETLEKYRKETQKCQLLCSNCHREIHNKDYWKDYIMPSGSDKYEKFRQEVCNYYKETLSMIKTGTHFKKDYETIKNILEYCNIEINKENNHKSVSMIDLETNEVIRTFYSLSEAGNFLNKGKGGAAHISQACSGKRKTAYGYKWEWKTS